MKRNDSTDVEHQLAREVSQGGLFVLTGAGMSTDSGIPDYRRPDGSRRVTPMTYAEFRRSEDARRRYWIRSTLGWERFSQAQPNEGHAIVARWHQDGLISRLVTQNVDGLHAAAGLPSAVELHGNLGCVRCVTCDALLDRESFQDELVKANPALPQATKLLADGDAVVDSRWEKSFVLVPCRRCGSTLLKPDVVMFGESVEAHVVADCYAGVAQARAVLVLGSSLQVMSGYRLVLAARKAGKPVILVGQGAMRGEDAADLVIRATLTPTLKRVDASLRPGAGQR